MLLDHLLLSFLVFISPVFPPAIIPFAYALIGVRLVQWDGPTGLSFTTVIPAALSSIVIWLMYWYLHKKIQAFKTKRNNQDFISRMQYKVSTYLEKKKKISKINQKIKNYLATRNSKIALFLVTIFAIDSAIPDVIAIGIVRKKLPFPLFVLAAVLGKATVYLPVIWLGKWLLIRFKTRRW